MWRREQDALHAYMNYLMLYVLDVAQRKIIRPVAYSRRKTRRTVLFVCFLPQLQIISQSVWVICRCRHARVQTTLLASICQAMPFSSSQKHFLWCWYCGKKQIECSLALSMLLSTMIRVITVVKICCGLTWLCLVSTQLLWWRISLSITKEYRQRQTTFDLVKCLTEFDQTDNARVLSIRMAVFTLRNTLVKT